MRRLGVKSSRFNLLGGKNVNRGLKIGAKALGYAGDLAPVAMVLAPEIAPVLETAKMASIGLNSLRVGRQLVKHGRVV